jgi:hypothetical protein
MSMPNGGTQVVQTHFQKCHPQLNVMIRGLKNTAGDNQDQLHFLKMLTTEQSHTVVTSSLMQSLKTSIQTRSYIYTLSLVSHPRIH